MRFSTTAVALAAAVVLLVVAAPAASAAGACQSANASAGSATKRALVRATLCVLNAQRARHNLRPLRLNRKLSRAARRHSRAMAARHFFSHTSLSGASFVDRIRRTGYLSGARSWSVERTSPTARAAAPAPRSIGNAWMNSAGHRANILRSSYRAIGIGIALGTPTGGRGATYTTDFGRRG